VLRLLDSANLSLRYAVHFLKNSATASEMADAMSWGRARCVKSGALDRVHAETSILGNLAVERLNLVLVHSDGSNVVPELAGVRVLLEPLHAGRELGLSSSCMAGS
jgi:hypothetical protein